MVVHGGTTTTSKKVAEYGGNVHGFGSRSVLGSGWPKDPIKVIVIGIVSMFTRCCNSLYVLCTG